MLTSHVIVVLLRNFHMPNGSSNPVLRVTNHSHGSLTRLLFYYVFLNLLLLNYNIFHSDNIY